MEEKSVDSITVLKETEGEGKKLVEEARARKEETVKRANEKARAIIEKAHEKAKALKNELLLKGREEIKEEEEKKLKEFSKKTDEIKKIKLSSKQVEEIFSKFFGGYHA
ncbi:MAG: hypothetical protein NT130_00060 [Candidatus Micrarchaeota archaeon]|nr:hypothetical protein [Candidatus Micrarchaeota archaeon]